MALMERPRTKGLVPAAVLWGVLWRRLVGWGLVRPAIPVLGTVYGSWSPQLKLLRVCQDRRHEQFKGIQV